MGTHPADFIFCVRKVLEVNARGIAHNGPQYGNENETDCKRNNGPAQPQGAHPISLYWALTKWLFNVAFCHSKI